MREPLTQEQIENLPPLVSINQASKLLRWDHGTLTREVRAGTFPIQGVAKGTRLMLPKAPLLELISGRLTANRGAA
jgi:hypothetical protein